MFHGPLFAYSKAQLGGKFTTIHRVILNLHGTQVENFQISRQVIQLAYPWWPRGLRRSAAVHLLGLGVRILPGDMDVCIWRLLCVVR